MAANPSAGSLTDQQQSLNGAPFLSDIDWRRPWLASIRNTAARILHAGSWREAVNMAARDAGLRNHIGKSIHFVPQSDLPHGTAYEAFISATGSVPTRENLHDFFNALVWLTFPRIKIQLNAVQAREIIRSTGAGESGAPKVRGRVRDAATLFDENAALLVLRDTHLLNALRSHRWMEALYDRKATFWESCEVWLFGHALMEKLVHPYKSITAHAWPVLADAAFFGLPGAAKAAWIDDTVSRQLDGSLTTSEFTPLPVLGVPGWWAGQDAAFYRDTSVFRPKRQP